MEDFARAGGLQAVMKSMESLLDISVMTVSGKSLADNLKKARTGTTRSNSIQGMFVLFSVFP